MDKYKTTMIGKTAKEVMSNFKTKEDAIEALEVLISAFKNEEKIIKMFEDGVEELYERMSRITGVSKQMVTNVINNHMCSIVFDAEHRYDEVVFDHREEAEEVLDLMIDSIHSYGCCSVADLYDLTGVISQFRDSKVGWTDIKKASIARARTGYVLKLPKPVTLK